MLTDGDGVAQQFHECPVLSNTYITLTLASLPTPKRRGLAGSKGKIADCWGKKLDWWVAGGGVVGVTVGACPRGVVGVTVGAHRKRENASDREKTKDKRQKTEKRQLSLFA